MRKLGNLIGTTHLALAALAVAVVVSSASCGQTPTNVPIRTFEGAQRVAVVCLQVANTTGGATPLTQNNCIPDAPGVDGANLPNHLIAAVTQTTRGELAIVDITAGTVVDQDRSTPGINFIPVGTNPTDVVIPPDGAWTYVSSASPRSPAIYAIDNRRLLGDSTAVQTAPLTLVNLTACALSQPPLALAIASVGNQSELSGSGADGGLGVDGGRGADGGSVADGGSGSGKAPYAIIALLGTQGSADAKIVAIDPTPFIDGSQTPGALPPCVIEGSVTISATALPINPPAGPAWPDGVPYVDGGVDIDGQLPPPGPAPICGGGADGGVAEAGAPVEAGALAEAGSGDAAVETPDGGLDGGAEDGAVPAPEPVDAEVSPPEAGTTMVASAEAGTADGGLGLATLPLAAPSPMAMVMRDDNHLLYVSDSALPLIHVISLADPTHPQELPQPLLATSLAQPTRQVQLGGIALSPPTRDFKRYLYAIDNPGGSIMVFDVTDASSPHVPLQRPHAELNPFSPIDRLTFAAPVATMAFVQHDWPLVVPTTLAPPGTMNSQQLAYQGLLCNPNQAAHPDSNTFTDLGAFYRVDQALNIQPNATVENFPTRLRGIFAFATLSNGSVVAIDVDDWDAPCRRPDPMSADGGLTGSLDVPEPNPMSTNASPDLDPFHTPTAYNTSSPTLAETSAVTLEPFFPVSAPHRLRSSVLVRNDPTSGDHIPNLVQVPQLSDVNGTPVATSGQAGIVEPILLPTVLQPGFVDPTLVENPAEPNPNTRMVLPSPATTPNPQVGPAAGVRLSFEDPTVQMNQDWTVTYEGALPNSSATAAIASTDPNLSAPDAFSTLTFSSTGVNLCGLGIEDWDTGKVRANAALAQMASEQPPLPVSDLEKTLPTWTADYVEITDDILLQGDQYWSLPNACWDVPGSGLADNGDANTAASLANDRYGSCQAFFGAPGSNPDLNVNRDAPILEAYRDHLKVGRWGFSGPLERTQNRTVDPGSSNNPAFLKLLTCCFHSLANFKVRAGGEWVAVGQQSLGLLNKVETDPATNRCVLSCDPQKALLNARSFDVPWGTATNNAASCAVPALPAIGRNDPLAMRNPLFSYVTWGGCGTPMSGDHTVTARDLTWRFSVSGGFTPIAIDLSGGVAGTSVNPQSMLFIDSLGELAVVDGADQGLILIDLNTVAFASNYF
jgi:hypothetical protein